MKKIEERKAIVYAINKQAKKKKKKGKKKPKPTKPDLWQKAQAKARSKFKVHPSAYCVPEDNSFALTKNGWKTVFELDIDDEILAYDVLTDSLRYTKIINLHRFKNEEILNVKSKGLNYEFECTPSHKVVFGTDRNWKENYNLKLKDLKKTFKLIQKLKNKEITFRDAAKKKSSIQRYYEKYKNCNWEEFILLTKNSLPKTKEVSLISKTNGFILGTAPLHKEYKGSKKLQKYAKYTSDPIELVLNMSKKELDAFLAASLMCNGWISNNNKTISHGFKQKNLENLEAVKLAGFLTGHLVSEHNDFQNECKSLNIRERRIISTSSLEITKMSKKKDVWCPETKYGTWVMKQGATITITGNSNAFAAKEYKKMGGGWRMSKADDHENAADDAEDSLLLDILEGLGEAFETDHECMTPGAQYEFGIHPDLIHINVALPFEFEMSEEDAEDLEDEIHDALEKVLAPIFNDEPENDSKDNYKGGLRKWFKEDWVDVSRKDKSGKHPPCGRSKAKSGKYPKCRPSKKVDKSTPETTKSMSKKDKESATEQKRRKERKNPKKGKGNKPSYDRHRKRD